AAGDEEADKRVALVARTAQRLRDGLPCDGWPKLAERLGAGGEQVVGQLKLLLGLTVTLEQLAGHQRLPVDFLNGEGLHDLPGGGVGIPYRDAAGHLVAVKHRTALRAKDGSYWPRGQPPRAYGEERLAEAVAEGRLLLVEGETDVLALRFHGRH